jgi:hypothetical protein
VFLFIFNSSKIKFQAILHDDVLYPVWLSKEAVNILKAVSHSLLYVMMVGFSVHDEKSIEAARLCGVGRRRGRD